MPLTTEELRKEYPDLFQFWWDQGYNVGKRTGWREGREHLREDVKKKLKQDGLISVKESDGKIQHWKNIANEYLEIIRRSKKRPYLSTPRRKKDKLLKIQDFKCIYCFCPLTLETATFDHVVPKSKGGKNAMSNGVIACNDCNKKKGNSIVESIPLSV